MKLIAGVKPLVFYLAGGYTGSVAVPINEKFNKNTETFSATNNLPTKLYAGFTAKELKNYYIFGGYNGKQHSNTVYSFINETWSVNQTSNYARSLGSSILFTDAAYWSGGVDSNGTAQTLFLKFKSKTISVLTNTALPALIGTSSSSNTSIGFLFGGYGPTTFSQNVYSFFKNVETAYLVNSVLPNPRIHMTSVYNEVKTYLINGATALGNTSGLDGGSNLVTIINCFTYLNRTMSISKASLTYAGSGAAGARLLSTGYISGGFQSSSTSKSIGSTGSVSKLDFNTEMTSIISYSLSVSRGLSFSLS